MIGTLVYGLTIGGILYIISIGLSLTFGTMRIVNFAHALVYTIGPYLLITSMRTLGIGFLASVAVGVALVLPISWVIEAFVIRRLYGESLDYAIIATYAVLLIGVDAIKWIWGATPIPLSDPIGADVQVLGVSVPVYRLVIIATAFLIHGALIVFFRRVIVGKIVVAGLDDKDAVRAMGIDVDRHFSFVFVLGSSLAALGGILYAPITSIHPYMGFHVLLLCFAVVIVGGMGSLRGTFLAAFALGLLIAMTARFWGPAAETMVFVVMGVVLVFKPLEV
jgi:branched-subunit amino acid ABC-type transport system permease component